MTTPTTKSTKNLTDAQKAEITALHAAGASRNAIARQTGINSAIVSTFAQEAGLKFNTRVTEAATRAKDAENAEKRALLLSYQLDDALHFRSMMYQPMTIGNFGGRDNTWNEVTLESPPTGDLLRLQQAMNSAIRNALQLMEAEAGSNRAIINLVIATAEQLGLAETDGE